MSPHGLFLDIDSRISDGKSSISTLTCRDHNGDQKQRTFGPLLSFNLMVFTKQVTSGPLSPIDISNIE